MSKDRKNLLLVVGAAIIILLSLAIMIYSFNISAVDSKSEDTVEFTVNNGDTFYKVGANLEKQGLIKSEMFFKLYVRFSQPTQLEAGTYTLSPSFSVSDIVNVLTSGNAKNPYAINITFPEGVNLEEMAAIIESKTNNSKESILDAWNDEAFLKEMMDQYWFIDESILNENIRYGLEGYLFPSTYEFKNADVTPKTIAIRLLDQMDLVLTQDKELIENSGFTPHEVLTLASIIEYEAVLDEDRAMISGVFYNRLNSNMKLQSCATLGYAINEHKLVYSTADTQVKSPYNTYYISGLPIGPGGAPSKESIEAALEPAEHEYFFFLANVYDEKDKKTYYAKTYAEHLENKKKYLK